MGLNNEDIKQLISILQRGLQNDGDENIPETEHKPRKQNKSKKTSTNNFDKMTEKNMHKEDTKVDKLLRVSPPPQRARQYKPIKVICRVCGKSESVDPSLVESRDRYKCNKCSASAG